jgi:hypothetical protein
MFGKCVLRNINWTVAAQTKYPNCRIFAKKTISSPRIDVAIFTGRQLWKLSLRF